MTSSTVTAGRAGYSRTRVGQNVEANLASPLPPFVAGRGLVGDIDIGGMQRFGDALLGEAQRLDVATGRVVRLEGFETENGPDLFVYLSAASASVEGREYVEDFVNLGRLKGNIGDQNYEIPASVPTEKIKSIVIWCQPVQIAYAAVALA